MKQCFLSHAAIHRNHAQFLKEKILDLYPENVDIFLSSDPSSLPPGEKWYTTIVEKLKEADKLLVLLAPSFAERPWIMFEAGIGAALNKTVIPLRYAGLTADLIPNPLMPNQSIELTQQNEVAQMLLTLATSRPPSEARLRKTSNNIAKYFAKVETGGDSIPEPIVNFLSKFPDLKTDYDIRARRVKTTRESLFKAVKYIYDSLDSESEVICTDHLDLSKKLFKRYWATEGLNHLRNNHEASGRGIKIKRVFIFCERDIEEHADLIERLCKLHILAGVEPMIATYEKLPRECLYEFALFGDKYLDKATYDFRSEWVIENYIHWSPHMLASFRAKGDLIETYSQSGLARQSHRAKDFLIVKDFAQEYLKHVKK